MFEDSRTKVMVCNVTNADVASFTALAALTGSAAAFFTEPQTFTEAAITTTNTTLAFRNTKGVLSFVRDITAAKIKNGGYAAYSARVEQVSYLGYNGTSGSMDATNSTYYGLQVVLNHTFGMLNNSPLIVTIPYKTDASATQSELAAGLAIAGTNIMKRHNSCIKIERINSGAKSADVGNITCTNGGTQIKSAADDTATILVGSILRFGTTGAGTTPCYIVTAHDSGAGAARLYTLDQPYQGTTTAAKADVETVTEGNWGIKFTGVSVTDANFDPINDEPFVVDFTLLSGDFSTATVTNTTKPFIGTGTYQLVAAQEARAQFENKTKQISAYPRTVYNLDAVAGNTYNIFAFELWRDDYVTLGGVRPVSKERVELAVLVGLTEAFHTVLGFGA